MTISEYYIAVVHMGSVCVSVVLCHLFVHGYIRQFGHGGLQLFLPLRGSTSDPSVVSSNTNRYIFVYLTCVYIFSRHNQGTGWQLLSQSV